MKEIKLKSKNLLCKDGLLQIYHYYDNKPMVLVLPGGSYRFLADREAYPVGEKFKSFGYNYAVLRYSVDKFHNPTQYQEGKTALKILSKKYKGIFICGFSAGGHLTGILSTNKHSNKYLKGSIYCYPVITFKDKLTHEESRKIFLNNKINKRNINKYSIEKRIDKNTPPAFIWTTKTDDCVDYRNSELLYKSMKKNKRPVTYKLFPKGPHGMSLGTKLTMDNNPKNVDKEVATWPTLANKFIKENLK